MALVVKTLAVLVAMSVVAAVVGMFAEVRAEARLAADTLGLVFALVFEP